MKSTTQQPTFRDKRLPTGSTVWTDTSDLRWHFLFGGLFVPERPIDLEDQPNLGGEDQPDETPTPEEKEIQWVMGTENPDGDDNAAGEGDSNPDADDASGESEFDSDLDTDSEPDHQPADNDGDETDPDADSEDEADAEGDGDPDSDEDNDDFDDESEDEAGDEDDGDDFNPDEFGFDKPANPNPGLPGHEVTMNNGREDHIRTFDSWYEFVQCASDESLRAWTYSSCAFTETWSKKDDYYATRSMSEAVDMALWSGWPEGRDMLVDLMTQVIPTNAYRVHHELDVAGGYPIVSIYCGGDPACMVSIETETLHNQRPIVRIDYNNTCSHYITTKSMMAMGAAVLSFAQSLENAGYSTELRVIGNCCSRNKNFRVNVTYKRAGEPLDLDRAAFAIAHPSVLRRFFLGLMEQEAELQHFGIDGHGYPMRQANDPTSGKPGGAIFIPPCATNKEINACKEIVEAAAADLISQLNANKAA